MTVTILRGSERLQAVGKSDESLHRLLVRAGVALDAPCGGKGTCGKCRVRIEGQDDWVLACRTPAEDGMIVHLSEAGDARIQVDGELREVRLDPAVTKAHPTLAAATLDRPADTWSRLLHCLPGLELPDLRAMKAMNAIESPGAAVVLFDAKRPLAFFPASDTIGLYGAAVDIGTTTVVAYLVDLASGKTLATQSALNTQRPYGADVIARAEEAGRQEGLHRLSAAIRQQIDGMIAAACTEAGIPSRHVHHIALAGNTIMMHLLLGLPVERITQAPFAPLLAQGMDLPAGELFPSFPYAIATALPCVAGYVGADTVAALLAAGEPLPGEPTLLVDIGTNGEMALAFDGQIITCSAAAGPAFEGAHIAHGMGGVAGAIDRVWAEDGDLRHTTIAGVPAQGVCGSGLVDAVAALLTLGALEETGRLEEPGAHAFLLDREGETIASLGNGVCLTQKDIREVQLAKGAIAAGIDILLKEAGLAPKDIRHTLLAGGFGSHIDPDSACRIGILPVALRESIRAVGNAAGAGARMALLDKAAREAAEDIRKRTRYIELSARADFQDRFVENMLFS